jgi:hypothetical protein
MFGNIICPGMTASVTLFPAWLTNRLAARNGANLLGLWFGQLVVSGTDVLRQTARVGADLTNVDTNFWRTRVVTSGHEGHTTNSLLGGDLAALACPEIPYKSAMVVCGIPTLPFSVNSACVRSTNAVTIVGAIGASALYTASGHTHYMDGIQTATVSAGVHLIQSDWATTATGALAIGSNVGGGVGTLNWCAPIYFTALFGAIPDAETRASNTVDCQRYFRRILP